MGPRRRRTLVDGAGGGVSGAVVSCVGLSPSSSATSSNASVHSESSLFVAATFVLPGSS
jgi:hypothetical protein